MFESVILNSSIIRGCVTYHSEIALETYNCWEVMLLSKIKSSENDRSKS